jgi:hypothetical protein
MKITELEDGSVEVTEMVGEINARYRSRFGCPAIAILGPCDASSIHIVTRYTKEEYDDRTKQSK